MSLNQFHSRFPMFPELSPLLLLVSPKIGGEICEVAVTASLAMDEQISSRLDSVK